MFRFLLTFCTGLVLLVGLPATAYADEPTSPLPDYRVQPGDLLRISVWREADLQREVRVRPDGGFTFPLAGSIDALNRTADELRDDIVLKLKPYLPNPVVTVSLQEMSGNRIYVIGRVNRPGEFVMIRPVTVLQALAMAGGLTPYADEEGIQVLRGSGVDEVSIPFDYAQVQLGQQLEQNRVLLPGDVVIVP